MEIIKEYVDYTKTKFNERSRDAKEFIVGLDITEKDVRRVFMTIVWVARTWLKMLVYVHVLVIIFASGYVPEFREITHEAGTFGQMHQSIAGYFTLPFSILGTAMAAIFKFLGR